MLHQIIGSGLEGQLLTPTDEPKLEISPAMTRMQAPAMARHRLTRTTNIVRGPFSFRQSNSVTTTVRRTDISETEQPATDMMLRAFLCCAAI